MKKLRRQWYKIQIWIVKITQTLKQKQHTEPTVLSHHHLITISKDLLRVRNCTMLTIRPVHCLQARLPIQQNYLKQDKEFCTEEPITYQCPSLLIMKNLYHAIHHRLNLILNLIMLASLMTITNRKECTIMNNINSWKAKELPGLLPKAIITTVEKMLMNLVSSRILQETLPGSTKEKLNPRNFQLMKNRALVHNHWQTWIPNKELDPQIKNMKTVWMVIIRS